MSLPVPKMSPALAVRGARFCTLCGGSHSRSKCPWDGDGSIVDLDRRHGTADRRIAPPSGAFGMPVSALQALTDDAQDLGIE